MRIYNDNPIVRRAEVWAIQYDKVLDNYRYYMIFGDVNPNMENIFNRRVEDIKDDYFWSIDSETFYKTNNKYLPFDLAVDLNIEMAKYLINEQIDNKESGNPF